VSFERDEIEQAKTFYRYLDVDGDGIPYRTYPGVHPKRGAYVTRGSSHDSYARYTEAGDAFLWKMPQFDLDEHEVHEMIRKANKYKSLILDLRGNGGGSVETMQRLAGALVGDVKIADMRMRKDEKPLNAKASPSTKFSGPLVVIIDSDSASGSELLARVVQLEKRGTVIGDRSAGAVMQSRLIGLQVGADNVVPYGLSVTDADLIMRDGKSLEHTGVVPDEIARARREDRVGGPRSEKSRHAVPGGVAQVVCWRVSRLCTSNARASCLPPSP